MTTPQDSFVIEKKRLYFYAQMDDTEGMSNNTPLQNWTAATAELRSELEAVAYEKALAAIEAERKGKATTETQRNKARRAAKGVVLSKLYKMASYNGVANPTFDDPEWGYGQVSAAVKETEAANADPTLEDLVKWLEEQNWSEFAQSLAKQYRSKGSLSVKQINAAKSMRTKTEASRKAREQKPLISSKTTALDLTDLPSGYYAVPGGDTRLKVRVARPTKNSRWYGWTFVSDGAEYGQRKNYGKQAPSGKYQGDIAEELAAILADPFGAMTAYGKLTGTCGACGRKLEDEESVAAGIGPWCRSKWAA